MVFTMWSRENTGRDLTPVRCPSERKTEPGYILPSIQNIPPPGAVSLIEKHGKITSLSGYKTSDTIA